MTADDIVTVLFYMVLFAIAVYLIVWHPPK